MLDAFYGDYHQIRALAFAASGNLVAATRGGLIVFDSKGGHSYGAAGLLHGHGPDNVWVDGSTVLVSQGEFVSAWKGGHLVELPGRVAPKTPLPRMPIGSVGTHISAASGSYVAVYGDGIWAGGQRVVGQPSSLRQAISLVSSGDQVAAATSTGEVWLRTKNRWRRLDLPNGVSGSVYRLASYSGRVYGASFENGVAVWNGSRWSQDSFVASPREMVPFRDSLYVRTTTGEIDRLGNQWSHDVFGFLPRRSASCLSISDGRLMVGQFGGWSEFDGVRWTHFFGLPELEGAVVTALASFGGKAYIGTQRQGLFVFDRASRTVRNIDQRQGLGDDWVRHLLVDRRGVIVGTFAAGAFALRGDSCVSLTPGLQGEVTGLVRDRLGRLWIGSRKGLWRMGVASAALVNGLEVQGLLVDRGRFWVGTPEGVWAVSR